jgi:transposase InsO family protein
MQVTKFRDLAPDEIALAEKGERAARAKRMVLQIEAGRRNELWLADYKALDVQLLVPRTTRPRRPWAVLIVDAYSRKLVGWSIALTRHSQAEVLAALQAAIADHGTPETLMFDKGLEFTADAVRDAARDLVFAAVSTREYRPHHKGKIERLAQTLGHRVVRHLAHRTDLPVTMSGEPIVQIRDDEGNPVPGLFADAFIERFAIEATLYNRRVHSALAATPESVYREDGWPERLVSPEHLERFMLKGGIRTVREGGIRFANKWYFAEQLDGHRGVKVEIRYRQDIPDKLHVYRDGRKWCVATVHNRAGASAREAVLASRRKRVNEAGRIKRRARKLAERRFRVITADHRAPEETTVITRADVAAELPGPSARQRRAMAALRSGSDTSERVTGPGKDAQ